MRFWVAVRGGVTLIVVSAIGQHRWLLLFFAALAATVVYLLACWWWPFAPCVRCSGLGKFHSWWGSGKAWRKCRLCKGTGDRLRVGRRVWNSVRPG
jgi:hypothetical protein